MPPHYSCATSSFGCGRKKVRKLLSSPAIQFKGTGWYITDYQRKGSNASLPDHTESDKDKKKTEKEGEKKTAKTDKPRTGKKD